MIYCALKYFLFNFDLTEKEDKNLCKAWITISQDPILGSDQKSDKFWSRITMEYDGFTSTLDIKRQESACRQRWSKLIMMFLNFWESMPKLNL
jgi:hypothetical protein